MSLWKKMETFTFLYRVFVNEAPEFSENKLRHIFMICLGKDRIGGKVPTKRAKDSQRSLKTVSCEKKCSCEMRWEAILSTSSKLCQFFNKKLLHFYERLLKCKPVKQIYNFLTKVLE